MDRQIFAGNKVIASYMQDRQKKRFQQKIKYIKTNKSAYCSKGLIKQKPRINSIYLQKNLQIQKKNIVIFNRIASIIKKPPKIEFPSSTSLNKSRETSVFWHRKIQSSLQQQNKIIQKRLNNQKPTINNKIFYRQRANHEKYLKNMGKYPYILNRKLKTQADANIEDETNVQNVQLPYLQKINPSKLKQFFCKNILGQNPSKQLYKHASLDFTIHIDHDLISDLFAIVIQSNYSQDEKYTLTMTKVQFVQFFQQSQYDYQKLISKLRLDNEGKIVYLHQRQNNVKTVQQENQIVNFKANTTGYNSTCSKSGFRLKKRKIVPRYQNQQKLTSKSQTQINRCYGNTQDRTKQTSQVMKNLEKNNSTLRSQKHQQKNNVTQRSQALTQSKFSQINLGQKE